MSDNKQVILYASQAAALLNIALPALQRLASAIGDYAATADDGVTDDELKAELESIKALSDAVMKPLPEE